MELRSRRLVPAAMAVALSGLLFPVLAAAAGYSQTAELSASNGSAADSFGYASALSSDGSTALVGAPLISLGAGEAYVYAPSGSGWTQQSTLLPNDAAGGDTFGSAVALSSNGDIALVGAPSKSTGTGAAYFFERSGSTWTQAQELSGPATNTGFGVSVSLSSDGSTALVGANLASSSAGAAYVYAFSGGTWTLQQQLTPTPASAAGDQFGDSVSLSADGDTALVGAPGYSSLEGSAYAFTRTGTTWTQHQQITEPTPVAADQFGSAVSLSGDASTALIGADGAASSAGTAYVYTTGTTWTKQAQLTASDTTSGDNFGYSAALDATGETAVVGAPGKGTYTGAAYLFARSGSTWTQSQEVTAGDAAADHRFGNSVATSNDAGIILVGADSKATASTAYVFAAPSPTPSPTPSGSGALPVPSVGAAPTTTLPGAALAAGGLALLLCGALARRRRSLLP